MILQVDAMIKDINLNDSEWKARNTEYEKSWEIKS